MKHSKHEWKSNILPALVTVSPVAVCMLFLVLIPLVYVVVMSFCSIDEYYNVVAGTGTLIAADSVYAGSVLVSNSGTNKLVSGKGNDIFFSGVGTDQFVFGKDFGNDKIVASNSADTIKFNDVFDSSKYTIAQKGNDLVISYQESKTATADTVTLVNWEVSASKTNKVSFDNGNYSISNNQFVKL